MATFREWYLWEMTDAAGKVHRGEAMQSPATVTASTGAVHEQTYSIATSTTQKIFDIDEDMADFDVMVITSDTAVHLEVICDDDNNVGQTVMTFKLAPNLPFRLGSNVSYANHTENFATGTLDVIETVRVRNISGGTALVHIFAAT